MIYLDKNGYELLAYLLQLDKPETIMAISRSIQQSRRKIYYHLEKINDALPDSIPPITSQPRVGICLTSEQKKVCQEILDGLDAYSYVMSMEERMQLMIVYICVSQERITIDSLMNLTEVSRNTVLNDLHEIRQGLSGEQYKVNLNSTKTKGYFFDCHPLNKIQYMHALLYRIFSEGSPGFLQVLNEKLESSESCAPFLSEDLKDFLKQQVGLVQKSLGKKINHHEIAFMLDILPFLLLGYRNMCLSKDEIQTIHQEFKLIRQRKEYYVAQELGNNLEQKLGISLDEIEVSLIAVLLLSYRKDRDNHTNSQDFLELTSIIEQFIQEFEKKSNYVIEHREDLAKHLLIHIKSLLFRKTYGLYSPNPLTQQIKSQYRQLFQITKECAPILEEAWLINLTEDDIAYLTIHFGGAIETPSKRKKEMREVYLVCDEGIAMQKLLYKQCQQYLPEGSIRAVFTTEQFRSVEDLLEVDLIITTTDILSENLPMLLVQPILTYDDIRHIMILSQSKIIADEMTYFDQALNKILVAQLDNPQQVETLREQIYQLIQYELITPHFQEK